MTDHTYASAVVTSMKTHARKPADLYPTPADATQVIIPFLPLKPGARIKEPACGDGDMARVFLANGFEVDASDLRHTGYGRGGVDFLTEYPVVVGEHDACVTNPPFNLAEKFITRSVALYPVVFLLLKANYWHTARGRRLWDKCPPTREYKVTWRIAFLEGERGKSPLMDCTWYGWVKGEPPIPWKPLARPDPSTVPDISVKPVSVLLKRLENAIDAWIESLNAGS